MRKTQVRGKANPKFAIPSAPGKRAGRPKGKPVAHIDDSKTNWKPVASKKKKK